MEVSSNCDLQNILLCVDSSEINYRVKSLDISGRYLSAIYNSRITTDSTTDDSFKAPIIFSILTRCDDISPEVRVQALRVLCQNARPIVKFLHETKDETVFRIEDGVDINELELEVNGEHRFYWYCMESFEKRQKEVMAMLRRRIDDDNISVRKSAVTAFSKLILLDSNFLSKKNLKSLKSASKDSDSSIRKLSAQLLNGILNANQNYPKIQELWLQCILPLVDDPEDKVQSVALSLLERCFLLEVFDYVLPERNVCLSLLKKLASNEFLVYHKFMKKSFSEWHLQNKLNPECLSRLLNCIGTEWEECLWFYLSFFVKVCPIPVEFSNLCVHYIRELRDTGVCPTFMKLVMTTFLHMLEILPEDVLTHVQGISVDGFASFAIPVELIPTHFDMLVKIHKLNRSILQLNQTSAAVVQTCKEVLLDIKKNASSGIFPNDDILAKYFLTLAEIYLFRSSYITSDMISLLVFFSGCNNNPIEFSSTIKTYALLALGKICLQHKSLAHELLPKYLEKIISGDDTMRNNAYLILLDMCKCYPEFTDKCIPIISLCFKDDLYLIRHQAILQIVNLLQTNYLKWKPPIFFGFLSTLIDKKEVIRELGLYALSHVLSPSEKEKLPVYFTHSIFVFNYFSPSNNEEVAINVRNLITFSIPGERRRKERLVLYKYFLEQMEVKEKAKAIAFVCYVLSNVAESVYPLNTSTESLIRDCFAILTCDEIKLVTRMKNMNEDLENIFIRVEQGARRTVLVDPVFKVMRSLKSCVKNAESNLMHDIILFLKDLLKDFIDDIPQILAEDKILLNQVLLEIRRDAERKRLKIKRKRDLLIDQ